MMKTCIIEWYQIRGTVHFEAMLKYKGDALAYYHTIEEAKEAAVKLGFTHYKIIDNFYNVSGRKVLKRKKGQ